MRSPVAGAGALLASLTLLLRAGAVAALEVRQQSHLRPHLQTLLSTAVRRSRRPVITGCLDECGGQDQNCVTECQVCVQASPSHCQTLQDYGCGHCLRAARANKRQTEQLDSLVRDSGGVPLRHEKVRQELQKARFEAFDAKRRLREARKEVISAMGKAEWAKEERRDAAKKLQERKLFMIRAEANAAKWELRNAKRLKVLRTTVEGRRVAHARTQAELEAAERRHTENLGKLSKENARARQGLQVADDGEESAAAQVAASAEDVKELRRMRAAQWRGLQRSEERLRKRVEDSRWLDSGIQHDMRSVQSSTKEVLQELRTMKYLEKHSQQRLEQAKEAYREAAADSQRCDEAVAKLEEELRKYPLPKPLEDEEDIFGPRPHASASVLLF